MILVTEKGNVYIPEGIINFSKTKMLQIAFRKTIPFSRMLFFVLLHINL